MMRTADTSPASIRQGERIVDRAARMAGFTKGVPAIHNREMSAVPRSHCTPIASAFSEAGIGDRLASSCLYGCFSRPQYLGVRPRKIGGTPDLFIGRGLTPGAETEQCLEGGH